MTTYTKALSRKDVATARRSVRVLRSRVAGTRSNAKINVEVAKLNAILKIVDAITVRRLYPGAVTRDPTSEDPIITDEISPQEAADILQMSGPAVMRLIEQGVLQYRKVLSRNKLSRIEVEAYRSKHARQQQQALKNMVALSEEYDF